MEVYQDKHRFRVVTAGRRFGKCLILNDFIYLADGRTVTLKDLNINEYLLTINPKTFKLESKRVIAKECNGFRPVYRISTGSNSLVCTDNHPFLKGNEWVELKNLKVGDLVGVPKRITFGNNRIDEALVDLLAIWLADGCLYTVTKPQGVLTDILAKAVEHFDCELVRLHPKEKPMLWNIRNKKVGINPIHAILKKYDLWDKNSKTKFIPDDIMNLQKDQLARFLSVFMSCDGSLSMGNKGKYRAELQLANEKMVRQFQELFLKFGIRCAFRKKVHKKKSSVTGENFVSYDIRFSEKEYILKFINEIGGMVDEPEKNAKAKKIAEESAGTCNFYLPISYDEFLPHARYDVDPSRLGKYGGYQGCFERGVNPKFREYMNSWRKQSRHRISTRRYEQLREFSDGFFNKFADGDVAWEEITSIEYVGEEPTYDIEVEDNHNFIANGFITHNSYLSRIELIAHATKPGTKCWYVAPTYRMAKQIMWGDLLDALPRQWIARQNETNLTLELTNGSKIELKGADKPDSLRGVGLDFLVLDEVQDISEETWTRVLRPTLADKHGTALFIGTPKSYNFLYKLHKLGQPGGTKDWKSWQFPTILSPFIPYAELEAAKKDMDEKSFRQEFQASFESMAGRVYYPFSRSTHIKNCAFNPGLPIWVGMDFNIDPMSTVILQPQTNGELWAVAEIVQNSSNTEDMCQALEQKYYRWQDRVTIYPDPAGGSRQHARGETDLDIMREHGFKRIKYRRQHPAVADRVNAVNRMLMSAEGETKLFIDPSCVHLIKALEQTVYLPNSRDVDKSLNIEHSADALGYAIELEYPLRKYVLAGLSR